MRLKKFGLALGGAISATLFVGVMNEPTAFAEVNHETSRLVEQSFNLSPGGSLGVSPDERWESITAEVSPNDYK